jgi:transcriptional regulator with PAS, ATPase and Fis domain
VEFVGASIDVTEHHRERAELEKAFEEIKRLRDQLHNENVVLREQIDQAFMFEEIVGTSSALQGVLSRVMKVAPTDSSVLVSGERLELVRNWSLAPSISDLVGRNAPS